MDQVSNVISSFQQGILEKKRFVTVIKTRFALDFCKILFKEGFISGYKIEDGFITIFFKYINGLPSITNLSRISKRSKRVYWDVKVFNRLKNYRGFFLISTSKGLLLVSHMQLNVSKIVGGEVILKLI